MGFREINFGLRSMRGTQCRIILFTNTEDDRWEYFLIQRKDFSCLKNKRGPRNKRTSVRIPQFVLQEAKGGHSRPSRRPTNLALGNFAGRRFGEVIGCIAFKTGKGRSGCGPKFRAENKASEKTPVFGIAAPSQPFLPGGPKGARLTILLPSHSDILKSNARPFTFCLNFVSLFGEPITNGRAHFFFS